MFIFSRNIEGNAIPSRYKPSIEKISRKEINGLELKLQFLSEPTAFAAWLSGVFCVRVFSRTFGQTFD